MRAVWFEQQGEAADVLTVGDIALGALGHAEVLVEVRASGVNPSDVKQRGGAPGRSLPFPRIVPHNDGAGTVVDVGRDVSRARLGERVWLYNAQHDRPFGTAAEYVQVPSVQAVRLPDGYSFEEGAGLGVPSLTACHAVTGYGALDGRTVLVTGAGGAVGTMAVAMAAERGATVFALVRSPEKRARVAAAGAHHVLSSTGEDERAELIEITGGRGIDHVIDVDLAGLASFICDVVATNGMIVSYGSSSNEATLPIRQIRQKAVSLLGFNVYRLRPHQLASAAAHVGRLLHMGLCRPSISAVFALDTCAQAHESVEGGSFGKVVISIR